MDRHLSAHAWQQRLARVTTIDDDLHRNTLAHFGEVATGVVRRREQRELTGCRAYDLADVTGVARTAVCIHVDIHKLPNSHVFNCTFIHVGGDFHATRVGLLDQCQLGGNDLTDHTGYLDDDPIE